MTMEPTLHFTQRVVTSLGYEAAIDAIKDALQGQGFGTLTEIDVRSTLKAKLEGELPVEQDLTR